MTETAACAIRYIDCFRFALVPLPRAQKAPVHEGWNRDDKLIRTVEQARAHWHRRPNDGFGVCLEPSNLVSVDPDFLEGARTILEAEGIELDQLIEQFPTIVGRAPRLEFAAPRDVTLSRKAIVWPAGGGYAEPVTVLEFRAGRLQDVLPPSVHPKTQAPYRWQTLPRRGFLPLPPKLLALWLDFDHFKHRARNLCPWAPPEPEPPIHAPRVFSNWGVSPVAISVIREFNQAHDVVSILQALGYVAEGKRRWKSPNGHGVAGVVLLPDGKLFCHHTSDPLGDGKPHDAFDLFVRFDHGGDVRAATRAAAKLLGMTGGNGGR